MQYNRLTDYSPQVHRLTNSSTLLSAPKDAGTAFLASGRGTGNLLLNWGGAGQGIKSSGGAGY